MIASSLLKLAIAAQVALPIVATLRGFNSYLGYCDGQPNETEMYAIWDHVADQLQPAGYNHMGMDVGWSGTWDAYGRMQPSTTKYPSSKGGKGFGPMYSKAHGMGFKTMLRIWRGIPLGAVKAKAKVFGTNYTVDQVVRWDRNCTWGGDYWPGSNAGWLGVNTSHPGGQAYYDSLARRDSAEHFSTLQCLNVRGLRITALNSHYRVLLCHSMTGRDVCAVGHGRD